jgi:hypothetical protein
MPRITRMVAAILAAGLLLAVPTANARLIDDPGIQTSSPAGADSRQDLRGADAQGAPTAPERKQDLRGADAKGVPPSAPKVYPGPPTWPLDPEPLVRPQPVPVAVGDDGTSPLAYILPAAGMTLMLGAAFAFAARSRRARVNA